jgi:hypothetical protein
MELQIHLQWDGPFGLATSEQRAAFNPPDTPGVYLWTVGTAVRPLIAYVGEAVSLRNRMYAHVFWTLGGGYCLFGDDHLITGSEPIAKYLPGPANLFTRYLDDFDNLSKLAYRNLTAYRIYWATVMHDRYVRQAVESALITSARQNQQPIQNPRLSRSSRNSTRMQIQSVFPGSSSLGGLPPLMRWGEIEPTTAE